MDVNMLLDEQKNIEKNILIKEIENNKEFYQKMCKLVDEIFLIFWLYKDIYRKTLLKVKLERRFFPDKRELREFQRVLERRLQDGSTLINYIMEYMTPESSWIIEKCYLDEETKDFTEWYLKHFSKTTFYKKKKIAILEFANLYLGLF
ncbi:hypothetical protein ONA00_06150 [Mycoplasmopsis cynos]|uniref:Phage protein n=4 Tax=Mycoplasmopsis cynos TaxID=171284 RepID=L0RWJ6_MYCC1|nr:hypothetical protein [Mycoplasmopsis cynos]WAM10850.1 hypothetical protein ONA00_06150 [Mycoplasmopsis cynos]CCP23930.1 Putative uncharacterized protein [Mycoplasmopsis cynos C142]